MKKYFNVVWIFFRILKEFQTPSTNIGKKIYKLFGIFELKNKNLKPSEILICFYDLNAAPTTFNFSEFILLCNNETLTKNLSGYKIIFIKKKKNLINKYTEDKQYRSVHDSESEEWKFNNIILPLISFTKYCVGYDFLESEKAVEKYLKYQHRYPEEYSKQFKININNLDLYNNIDNLDKIGLEIPSNTNVYIQEYLRKKFENTKKIITITIRSQKYDKIRNSNENDWLQFAQFLKNKNFEVVIIPDTDNAYSLDDKFKEFKIFHEGSFNLALRMGLYSNAFFNYFAGGGPSSLCTLHKSNKYIMFNYGPIEGSIVHTKESFENFKEAPKEKFKFANKNQILIWEKDNYENMIKSYNKYILNE